jgi:hypothetical protein
MCMYVCAYVYIDICIYVMYIYIHICIYIGSTHNNRKGADKERVIGDQVFLCYISFRGYIYMYMYL